MKFPLPKSTGISGWRDPQPGPWLREVRSLGDRGLEGSQHCASKRQDPPSRVALSESKLNRDLIERLTACEELAGLNLTTTPLSPVPSAARAIISLALPGGQFPIEPDPVVEMQTGAVF